MDNKHLNFRRPYIILLLILACVGCVFRFVGLENYPPGIFLDEQGGIANALCLLRNGTSIYHQPWPLFFPALGGFYDPIFIYSQALIASVFEPTIATFRIFPTLCLLAACFGTAALAWTFLGMEAALTALVVSLFCPWSFHAGRVVWGSGVITAFITWGLFFLWRTKFSEKTGVVLYIWAVLAGVFLAAAMSLYRPANAVVVLLMGFLFVFRPASIAIRFRYWFTALAAIIICGIPNIRYVMGAGMGRIDGLSIFGKDHMAKLNGSYESAVWEVLENYRKLLSWDFLFVSGDAIFRHTPAWGALGWPECCGLLSFALIFLHETYPGKKASLLDRSALAFLVFCVVAVLVGMVPAAQSWDSNPHALRANSSWPFFVLIATMGLTRLTLFGKFRYFSVGTVIISLTMLLFIPKFLSHYFFKFPPLAAGWANGDMLEAAQYAQKTGDWSKFAFIIKDYGRDGPPVFAMMYNGMDCPTAHAFVLKLHDDAEAAAKATASSVQVQPAPDAQSN